MDLETLWTIVPVRGLAAGKSRLAPVLDAAGRAALNRHLLARTLAVIGGWCGAIERCIVVSPCPRALALARVAGAASLREGRRALGLNHAAKLAVARAVAQGALHALVVPGDLPFLGAEALNALASAADRHPIVLAPDRGGRGTNALLVATATAFEFRFGPMSRAAHRRAAARAGLSVGVVRHKDLQFDLDTPADLAAWRQRRRPITNLAGPRRGPPFADRAGELVSG